MSFRSFLSALLVGGVLASPSAAFAGAYEWTSEITYLLRHGECKDFAADAVNEKLRKALVPACEAGLDGEVQQIVNDPNGLTDALFFEAARQELYEQTSCVASRLDDLLKKPDALAIYKKSLAAKLPELRRLQREIRDLDGVIGHYTEKLPRKPVIQIDEDGNDVTPADPNEGLRTQLAGWEKDRAKAAAAEESLLASIPFSNYASVKSALAKLPVDPEKNPKAFDKGVFKMLTAVNKSIPAQLLLVHPGQTLSTTAKEDVVQDDELASLVLKKFDFTKDEQKNLFCRLDARYGKGRADLDNILIWGSVVLFGPEARTFVAGAQAAARALAVPGRGVAAAARVGLAAKRLSPIGTALGGLTKWVSGGVLTVDSLRDIERFCSLTSPDHHATPSGTDARAGCAANDVVEELYTRDCVSYFAYWGLAINGGREAQKILRSELLGKIDGVGIDASNKLFNAGMTKDMIDMYLLPDQEEATKKKQRAGGAKKAPASAGAAPAAEIAHAIDASSESAEVKKADQAAKDDEDDEDDGDDGTEGN